jgi:hypothetical protein
MEEFDRKKALKRKAEIEKTLHDNHRPEDKLSRRETDPPFSSGPVQDASCGVKE